LLFDGLGDTIRVSLTEAPINEIPVAVAIAEMATGNLKRSSANGYSGFFKDVAYEVAESRNPFAWTKPVKKDLFVPLTSEKALVAYMASGSSVAEIKKELVEIVSLGQDRKPDLIWLENDIIGDLITEFGEFNFGLMNPGSDQLDVRYKAIMLDFDRLSRLENIVANNKTWIQVNSQFAPGQSKSSSDYLQNIEMMTNKLKSLHENYPNLALGISPLKDIGIARIVHTVLGKAKTEIPLILQNQYQGDEKSFSIKSSGVLGALLLDGIGDGIVFDSSLAPTVEMENHFAILQAARLRITQTEYISCPSCGRTLFDLEDTTARIKSRTGHLKGLKIAVMGCIVNGPGEMADDDFGYVGAGKGKINLYVGHQLVRKNIPTVEAEDELIRLIKEHNRWVEPG